MDDFAKVHSQAKVYLTSRESKASSIIDIDVGKFDNNRVVRLEHVDLQKNKGLSSGLMSYLYDVTVKLILEKDDPKALASMNFSDDLSVTQKINALFELLCSESDSEEDDLGAYQAPLMDFCAQKQWSNFKLTIDDNLMNAIDDSDVDSEWPKNLVVALAFLSKMYSQLNVSMPENSSSQTSQTSKFCQDDSGTPVYLEQDGKDLLAGVLSRIEPAKIPEYQDDRFKTMKQISYVVSGVTKNLLSRMNKSYRNCDYYANADYLYPEIPWILKTKADVVLSKKVDPDFDTF